MAPPVAASGRVEDLDPDLAAQLKEKLTQLENFGLLSVDGLLEPREDEAGAGSPADST